MSKFRYRFIQIFIVLAFLLIVSKLFKVQILESAKYQRKINLTKTKINKSRGEIVDRYSKVLALDINKYTLEYNPLMDSEDREELAKKLGQIIDLKNKNLLYSKASQTLAHNLTKEQAYKIRQLNSRLLYLRKIRSRVYPQGRLASHLLGYVDVYGKARQGLEYQYDDDLLNNSDTKLELSIDSRLQAFVEKELKQRIVETQAIRGVVMVMKVDTGEMLAWSAQPDYDPNKYFDYSLDEIKNWSLVDAYQPGSIFKIITVSSALDSNTVAQDYKFTDIGYVEVEKWKIRNHTYDPHKTKPEELSLQGLFERSSNPFTVNLALKMGRETFYRYIRKFGFGEKTGVELSGESKGILHNFKKWRDSDTATTGMGQGAISVTPLQLLAGVNVVANRGTWVKPTLLKFKPNASSVNNINTRSVLDPKVADHVSQLLAASVENNIKLRHSVSGNVPGLRIAGKTGTAEKINAKGGYSRRNTVASFLGFFPVENPKYIMLVVIDDPQTDGRWGDTVAGPVFNKVASYIKSLYF
jgi:cell division protein FtsI/penicillin-binding protein 2